MECSSNRRNQAQKSALKNWCWLVMGRRFICQAMHLTSRIVVNTCHSLCDIQRCCMKCGCRPTICAAVRLESVQGKSTSVTGIGAYKWFPRHFRVQLLSACQSGSYDRIAEVPNVVIVSKQATSRRGPATYVSTGQCLASYLPLGLPITLTTSMGYTLDFSTPANTALLIYILYSVQKIVFPSASLPTTIPNEFKHGYSWLPKSHPPIVLFKTYTPKTLEPFNGKDGGRILLAINGIVFDVTAGMSFYGPGPSVSPHQIVAETDSLRRWHVR